MRSSTKSGYAETTITNLIDGKYIGSNENELDYATSITIKLPSNEEITPVDIAGVRISYEEVSTSKDGVVDNPLYHEIIPFKLPNQNGNEWTGISQNDIYFGNKIYRSGRVERNIPMTDIEVPPKTYKLLIKLPADNAVDDNTNGCQLLTVFNNNDSVTKRIRIQLPPDILEETRGVWGWIKTAYKGVIWVAKRAQVIASVVDVVATTVVNVANEIDRVAGPIIELVDTVGDLTKDGSNRDDNGEVNISLSGTKLVITDNRYIENLERIRESKANETPVYTITDDLTTGLLGNTFDPTLAIEEYRNNDKIDVDDRPAVLKKWLELNTEN